MTGCWGSPGAVVATQGQQEGHSFREQLAASPEVAKMHERVCTSVCEEDSPRKKTKKKKKKKAKKKKKKKAEL